MKTSSKFKILGIHSYSEGVHSDGKSSKFSKITKKYLLVLILLLIQPVSPLYTQTVKLGVALPLFENSEDPSQKQLGNDILNGIRFALDNFNKNSNIKVEIDVKDTRKETETTIKIFEELAKNDDMVCILGPVFSSELAAVVNIGENNNISIISPTATGDELAEKHDYVFQLNPSYKVRGKSMAKYLIKETGFKNFVIIYEDTYGINFTRHFEKEVYSLKGKIILSEPFKKDTKNITDIIKKIHKVIKENDLFINFSDLNVTQIKKFEKAGVGSGLIDSLIELKTEASIYYLLGKSAKRILDTLNIKPHMLKDEDSKFIQGYIDAIYIPISNQSEISLIVPELFSNGLSFFIAGTGDWNNESALEDNKAYFKNFVFESEYFLDENSFKFQEFNSGLKNTKYNPN
ncbi:MAG: ABC transporter substrate-binding protein, partial [Ignavibacteria bacterium]